MKATVASGLALALALLSAAAHGGVPQYTLSPPTQTIRVGAMGTVTITQSFDPGGNLVALASSNTAVLTVPPNVNIPAGQLMATFQVTGVAPGTANVIADPNATAVTASVTVTPPPDAAILPDAAPDAAPDGAEPDAAEPRDSGMRDAPARDSGGSGGTGGTGGTSGGTSSDSGCGCVVGGRSPTSSAWLLVLVALPLLRRRGARMK